MEERIRKRIPKSCRRCHRRKQRCVGTPVCSNCHAANQPCLRSDRVPSWHHGMSKGALVERIELLETQLASLVDGGLSESGEQQQQQPPLYERMSPLRENLNETHGNAVMHLLIQGPEYENTRPEASYLGPSSGLSIAENISGIIHDSVWTKSIPVNENSEPVAPFGPEPLSTTPPDDVTGTRVLEAYFKSIHLRLPFVDRGEIYDLHARRHEPLGQTPREQFGRFKIFMVYAIGAAILKMTDSYDSTPPRNFFSTALQFEPSIRQSLSIASIEALMLLSVYNQQSSASSSLWYINGQAMRICVDFGLHREAQYRNVRPYEAERRRRLFWTVYSSDRAISWSLGRPFSIADEEIDAELPADIDDSITDNDAVAEMLKHPRDPTQRVEGPNVRCFIAMVRLSRIGARTRSRMYRVDQPVSALVPEILPLMESLEEYRKHIPCMSQYEDDFIHMHLNNAIRMVLQPFLVTLSPEDKLLRTCLQASGQMCQYFKRLRQRDSSWYSFLLINSIFMAGLTMCLCLFRSPGLWTTSVSNDLRACSSALFVMAERNAIVRKYRDALETVIDRVMDYVSDSSSSSSSNSNPDPSRTSYAHSSPITTAESLMRPIREAMDQSGLELRAPGLLPTDLQTSSHNHNLPTPEAQRPFPGIFIEDFWGGDSFGLHMGEAFGLRT